MRRCQVALELGIAGFDLQGRVPDLEAQFELATRFVQHPIVETGAGTDQVRGERSLRGAHRPDVQVVDLAYARQAAQVGLNGFVIDLAWDGIKREIDRIPSET